MRVGGRQWGVVLLLCVFLLILGIPAGLAEEGQIAGMVWLEKTVDGMIGGGESGLSGAKVTLERLDENGQPQVAVNTVSGNAGDFAFYTLSAGTYRLRVEAGSGYQFTLHGLDSAVLPAQGNVSYSPWFPLEEGESLIKNAGVTKTYCTVSLIAFEDENANGGRLQTEPVVRGVQAELIYEYEGETYTVATALTDKNGTAQIKDLSPGEYRLRVAFPEHYVAGPIGQKVSTYYNCVWPNEDGTGESDPFTLEPKGSMGLGVGMVRTGSLEGKIWFDTNYNGQWDGDETGLTEALVTLNSYALGLSRTAQANERGVYSFQGLQPGEYQLEFTLPEGMIFTYPGASLLSDIASQGGLTVSVQVDVTTNVGAVGVMPAAGLSLTLTGEEGGLSGAKVAAAQSGKTVATAITDENGAALFNALRGGETTLTVTLPEGWLFSDELDGLFPVSGPQSEAQVTVTLDGAQPDAEYSAAVTAAASISGMLFEDRDNTGLYQDDSSLLPGYTVQAVNESGEVCAQTVTDENGAYTLYPLLTGTYTVRFLLDDAYVASPFAADLAEQANHIIRQTPEYGETEARFQAPGEALRGLDGSVFRAGVVDGYMYIDEAYADSETGMAGITVTLLGADGQPVSDYSYGVTDETGYFFIKGVLPGEHSLSYALPDHSRFTDPATGDRQWVSDGFTTESGSEIHMAPLHGIYTAILSGVIYHDDLDSGEPFSALLTLRGHTVNQIQEIRTAADGSYMFRDLLPDTYTLTVALPDGLVFGPLDGAIIPAMSGVKASVEVSLTLGERYTDADMMASIPVSLSGQVFYDDDLSGDMGEEEYGAEERTLSLWAGEMEIAGTYTDGEGGFLFERLVPGPYALRIALDENERVVDWDGAEQMEEEWSLPVNLWADASVTLAIMRFGSVSGEVWSLDGLSNGVSGIPVSLLSGEDVVATVVTDTDGAYCFDTLLPGEYTLFAELPEGSLFANERDVRDRDSYIISQTDGTLTYLPFSLAMGDDISGIDLGIGANGRIGDRAWLDENGNGMQDMNEPNMPGIQIELYRYGKLVASTVTDMYGHYSLDNLYPGEYEMRVTMHAELKATVHQTEFPLVASILPEDNGLTVTVSSVIVPSGGENLHCDLGFQLRKKGVYPAAMDDIPAKDWRPYSER